MKMSSMKYLDRYVEMQKVDLYTRILNAPVFKKRINRNHKNLSRSVVVTQTRSGINRTIESVEDRRIRRNKYTQVLVNLVKLSGNRGFTLQDFLESLADHCLREITLYRHNDLVETLTFAATHYGIVFFRTEQDLYFMDDVNARFFKLMERPRGLAIAAGSQRGIKMAYKKNRDYAVVSRVARKMGKQHDRDVVSYVDTL